MTPRRPAPVPDLDWEPGRVAELGEAVVGLWSELAETLPERPITRGFDPEGVRAALALYVPE